MNTQILEDLGLTKNEIKVYIALLELGPSSAGSILTKTKLQNSATHFALNSLIEKSLVTYMKRGKARIYQAADPESLIEYVEDKKAQLKDLLPSLKKKQILAKEKEEVEIFEGTKGVMTAINLLIKDAKPKDKFLFFSTDIEGRDEEIQTMYQRFDAKRKAKGIISKGIAPKRLKRLFSKRKVLNMRYVNFPIPENTGICNDKMAIISWSSKPRAILITSKSIVKKQRLFFEQIWEMAKPSKT